MTNNKTKNTWYEINLWSNEENEDFHYFNLDEADEALNFYNSIKTDVSYVTVKKFTTNKFIERFGGFPEVTEYGEDETGLTDLVPLNKLPKYVQKKIARFFN